MTRPLTVLKSVGPKLVPFFKTVALFFVLYRGESYSSIFYAIFKCLPIISLIFFVLLHGMNFSEVYSYSRRILIGLVFSLLGDICMVYKTAGYFLHGVALFGVAQLLYASAFGMRPFNFKAGGVVASLGVIIYTFVFYPAITGVLSPAIGVYMALIGVMVWRAVSRVQLFDDLWTWTKLCSCGGAILFGISDMIIALDKFVIDIPLSQTIIMITYYGAQLGITLSVVDSHVDSLIETTKPRPIKVD
ncbi:lysoplasmalogenase TMEM86A-like [Tubulanus polymorphus]|uniref:lysoplasmalogenase TMEM86A-like n=1 Tax=Tubulanus polymorphus TaxID=672921 RepID=UPI003DA5AB92